VLMERLFNQIWYQQSPRWWPLQWLLLPLSALFCLLVAVRHFSYRHGLVRSSRVSVPVLVVGNLTVGGTGKTPLVIALVKWLQQQGHRPAVISRGYGRTSEDPILQVDSDGRATDYGDEPLLITQATGVPVYVGADRAIVANCVMAEQDPTIILSDDGLQHYRLQRDLELVVVDADRKLGNRYCLPAGPLREPASRLRSVDAVVWNGPAAGDGFSMQMRAAPLYRLDDRKQKVALEQFSGKQVHAVAGIGYPQRFFSLLEQAGVVVISHPFPDHHQYNRQDLQFDGSLPLLMTEKDAVKCQSLSGMEAEVWVVPVSVDLDTSLKQRLMDKLEEL